MTHSQTPSAIVDFESTTQGVLIPRMLESERLLISNPATGLLVYQTDGAAGFYFNYGSPTNAVWKLLGDDDDWSKTSDKVFVADTSRTLIYGDSILGWNSTLARTVYVPEPSDQFIDVNTKFLIDHDKHALRFGSPTEYEKNIFRKDSMGLFSISLGGRGLLARGNYAGTYNGYRNEVFDYSGYCTIVGGALNRVYNGSGFGSIFSGISNHIWGYNNVILGGESNTTTSENSTIIGGQENWTLGNSSVIIGGMDNRTHDYGEIAMGRYNRPGSGDSLNWSPINQLFSVGNGTSANNTDRHNAFSVYMNGEVRINDKYNLPSMDGTSGQIIFTDGVGNLSWQTPIDLVDDADNDPTNEIELPVGGSNGQLLQTDGLGTVSWTDVPVPALDTDLGIGTTSPVSELHIVGDDEHATLSISPVASASGDSSSIFLSEDNDATIGMYMMYDGQYDELKFGARTTLHQYGPHLSIERVSGDIGIGTSTPISKVHIKGDNSNTTMTITPNTTVSGDTSNLFLAEDDDGSFGMSVMYDGVNNELQFLGKSLSSLYGPHLVIKRGSSTRVGVGATNSSSEFNVEGDARISDYTQLGSDAPQIKMKKFSGTTSSSEGGNVSFIPGISSSKILAIDVILDKGSGNLILPGDEFTGYSYTVYGNLGEIVIDLSSGNSSNIVNTPYRVLITYEE